MTLLYMLGGATALALFLYLIVALLRPELF
jgi:K+-transporting ATPase KdpF subunit